MRRIVIASCVVLAGAAAVYGAYWLATAEKLRSGIERWAAQRQDEGQNLRWTTLAIGGFPLSFRVEVAGIGLDGTRPLPFIAESPVLIGEARPWNLRFWWLSAPAGAQLAIPVEGATIKTAVLDGTLALGAAEGTAVTLNARDVALAGSSSVHLAQGELALTLPERAAEDHRDTAFTATVRLDDLTLPYALAPLGAKVDALTFSGSVKGAWPPGKLRDALALWREDGGTIELQDGSIRWGAFAVSANGTLALDEALQPIGALTATIEDHDAVIDTAVAQGSLRSSDASLAKAVLDMLAKPGPDGKPQIKVPLRLQDRRVYLGPARIATLPPVSWE